MNMPEEDEDINVEEFLKNMPQDFDDDEEIVISKSLKRAAAKASLQKKVAEKNRLQEQAQREKLKRLQEEGKLVDVDKVKEEWARVGAVTKTSMMKLINQLPPALLGKTSEEMIPIIEEQINKILKDIYDNA